jgi:iron complex outermembrane receptor protein
MIKYISILFGIVLTFQLSAQNYWLEGKVLDESNNPIAGANVYIIDSISGTVSDKNGKFVFKKIKNEDIRLKVTFVGYEPWTGNIKTAKYQDKLLTICLKQTSFSIDSVVVTATRYKKSINDIPGRLSVLTSSQIDEIPVNNMDDALRSIANVYVNRSWGIFSKNASVTMRGIEGSARTLILLNGVPLNKSAGGAINWHMINPDNVQKIEVIKGPASALYGGNAMAGVINIITKKPDKGWNGKLKAQTGSYGTLGGDFSLSMNGIENNKGFYAQLNSFYRQGDGYIYEPFDIRDSIDIPIALKEFSSTMLFGYQWNKNNKLEINYAFYKDHRGGGRKVYEEDGSYFALQNNYLNMRYKTKINKVNIELLGFYQFEDFLQQSENLNNYDEYKLNISHSRKQDHGLWLNFSRNFNDRNTLSWGFDFKYGDVQSLTTYKTATDILDYSGKLNFFALFLQDEYDIVPEKLKMIAGLRIDYASFYNGQLIVTDPTKNTGFTGSFTEYFSENNWYSFNPKIALKYFFNQQMDVYASASSGMLPPKLDDLCKSGKITKGFKMANPLLEPEKITTYEIGSGIKLPDALQIEPSVYYSLGKDFQYFVGTGDSIDTGGDELKPVIKRQNISEVEIMGAELSLNYKLSAKHKFVLSYAYNYSKIKHFEAPDSASNNLSGKYLMEVSPHVLYAALSSDWNYFNTYISYNYIDEQWADDENTILIDDYSLVNIKIYREFFDKLTTSFEVQNLFDVVYVDRKMRLSPGRFIILELQFRF